ncbi:hybrid sensor histidine kinase/response regulator [Anabaena cylindrica FACHB-243]|uniref:histidine kinase n=1 Tax=Anabaena cylindrica (strain ATCC 27899 / PCC 7122) TaxID=272123 RepID=K9ZBQ6_ANACC|nr:MULTISPECIES: response regulator [Anabaena]AFZ55790.1 response regulator receiver sensor signal transduction histidine kinase [Anabaena cylindrica PCC 7122]MBD2420208.1 hybrid sensor histidine kinase/response regulator [Anabaena cylindrica FACHB-243]MBY5283079.1 response regulator [Anabaena sp. CCAP 1446/1C]MBY5307796.1 response regulator [Anabaena sp. CCAP 1446/1C]MCM2406140.1 hybrid sensor histidine kinase/response regulator [Anabaena sp. CCAP 1446/1C]
MSDNLLSKPMYILLVDDNANNLKVLSEAIQGYGWKALMANDGESAIEQAEYAHPDLIILDVMMPGIDGFETCRRLKANSITQNIPIIFMTALSDATDKVKGLEIGAVDYVTKPFQQAEVIARLKLHLKLSHLTRTLEQQVEERTAELTKSLQQLQNTQLQMIQSEKMSALGNLVAGIAHEMNNPLGFISATLKQAKSNVSDIIEHLKLYQESLPNPSQEIINHAEDIDLDYCTEDISKMIDSMIVACDRIENISNSLRTFSRADRDYKQPFNLHEGIDSTILILKHRLKANEKRPAIEVFTEYGKIPKIECFPGQLNQVFMNILANAIDALEEANSKRTLEDIKARHNKIIVKTSVEDNQVKISITDNAQGMTEEVKEKIFDHLFTTKSIGKGTGLGLAIAQSIVVEKHNGSVVVNSKLDEGTEFVITLPIIT